ncbi:MAG: hypothetical protein IJW82_02210 [Clostridia bacterium]|nr:hypothetical protein [Clostridia bacterium]
MKKNKKKLKIKWKNVSLAVILLMCIGLILHDIFMITIYSWITGNLYGWTWLGLLTFILAIGIGGEIIEYFDDEINK